MPTFVAAGAVTGKAVGLLWPLTAAYLRDRITAEELRFAFERLLGDSGVTLASRMVYAAVLGPVFAWYLLARSVTLLGRAGS